MASLTEDLDFRGLIYQVSDPALRHELDHGHLCAYIGFDPTADSLHIGNLLQLCNLRRLQLAGHRPIALAGGGTGLIGDPGGRSEERRLLDADELAANLEGIRPQLERFLDFSPSAGAARARLLDNAAWLAPLRLLEFLREVGKHFTVGQMVAKEAVRSRLERPEGGISFTEFSYMLLQAYDFLHLYDTEGCRLQMGASDQWGNITAGIDLVRKVRGATVYGLTSPLVTKADGTKFGKSETGTVWLDPRRTSPFALYQHFVRVEDAVVGTYLRYFTFLGREAILELDEATARAPAQRRAQRALAAEVCRLVHGDEEAARAERASDALYSPEVARLGEEDLLVALEGAPSSTLSWSTLDAGADLVELLVASGLAPSKSGARRLIAEGAVYVNNERVRGGDGFVLRRDHVIAGRYVLLRRGRDLHLLALQ
ncbi:MAG TPA: tyrosine--tRNA ligase [Acidimicrobiales bacterium]|nr:tyrosine--tRNA ligase [Acidimicrobiales bacterium]